MSEFNEAVNTEESVTVKTETKKAVNVLDFLLGADSKKVSLPYADVEIPRLSEMFGSPFIVRCEALTPEMYEEVRDNAMTIEGKDVNVNLSELQTFSLIESVKVVSTDESGKTVAHGYLLKNTALMDHYNAPTPRELCKALFLPGEIQRLYDKITNLSGFTDEAVVELKN